MFGIDVSEHQDNINWEVVKPQINFVMLRLGWIGNKNNHTIDSQFEKNYNECKRLGIPVGVYIYNYCNNEETVRSGANWVSEKLKGKTLELPVYLDMEDNSIAELGKDKLTNICIAFNTIIEQNGFWAGVYANLNWFNNYLNKDELKRRYTTWIAHYGLSGDSQYKGEYDVWQNSSNGKINGINGNVDTNYMHRNLLSEVSNKQPIIEKKSNEEIADEVIAMKWGVQPERQKLLEQAGYNYEEIRAIVNQKLNVNKSATVTKTVSNCSMLNLRTTPNYGNNVYKAVSKGTQVEFLGLENGWAKIRYEGRVLYCGRNYLT